MNEDCAGCRLRRGTSVLGSIYNSATLRIGEWGEVLVEPPSLEVVNAVGLLLGMKHVAKIDPQETCEHGLQATFLWEQEGGHMTPSRWTELAHRAIEALQR